VSSHCLCNWHVSGVPAHFQGEAHKWRWFVAGCPSCIAKWDGRAIPSDVPTPEQLIAAEKASRPRGSVERQRKEAAGRRAAYWTRPAMRVA
jgi:hypothetical protein